MNLDPTTVDRALTRAIELTTRSADEAQGEDAIRRAAVQAGADEMYSLVAKWLAFTSPSVHDAYLHEFKD